VLLVNLQVMPIHAEGVAKAATFVKYRRLARRSPKRAYPIRTFKKSGQQAT
jgi:hypothetical protein